MVSQQKAYQTKPFLATFPSLSIPEWLLIGRLQNSYGKYFNLRYDRKGRLFEGRYKAKKVDKDEDFLQVAKYIHRNPLKAGIVQKIGDYRWSSFGSYVSTLKEPWVMIDTLMEFFPKNKAIERFVEYTNEEFSPGEMSIHGEVMIDVGKVKKS